MIDNFDKISKLLRFSCKNDFYFLQVIKRRKDNPNMKHDSIQIDRFYIHSSDDLFRYKDRIIEMCEFNNARACIHLNRRNSEKVALQTLKIITDFIINKNFESVKFAYDSACGRFSSEGIKKWIIDVDDNSILDEVSTFLGKITQIVDIIPTKNGSHVVTHGFNPNLFKDKFPNIEIKKDNPTVLYIPSPFCSFYGGYNTQP